MDYVQADQVQHKHCGLKGPFLCGTVPWNIYGERGGLREMMIDVSGG